MFFPYIEPDWITEFAKKQEIEEKAKKLKVRCKEFEQKLCCDG
jgi:hypothetical protein